MIKCQNVRDHGWTDGKLGVTGNTVHKVHLGLFAQRIWECFCPNPLTLALWLYGIFICHSVYENWVKVSIMK